jgi:hypothetical protein
MNAVGCVGHAQYQDDETWIGSELNVVDPRVEDMPAAGG